MSAPSKQRLRELLTWIADTEAHNGYPISEGPKNPDGDIPDEVFRDIRYLADHGLCRPEYLEQHNDMRWHWAEPVRITTQGLDWLSEDGGLTAEKRTLTVKFDEDQFKALLIAKVDQSDATEEEKSKVKEAISKGSTVVLQAALTEVTKTGIAFLPHGFQWLQKLFVG
ncbi:hypothetical protein [Acetobacter indonesiensis]|uniref:hypothetical protein n=1 Tax=Acetobacter indonesiensis TaxID=104101 RepID=UPI0020A3BEB7|nr:hypothetical protein [Acetobacter indonesiensis]MCP1229842.1 hypothetical protein [Acetobacter indonesiensis]